MMNRLLIILGITVYAIFGLPKYGYASESSSLELTVIGQHNNTGAVHQIIARQYTEILGRQPDAYGLATYTKALLYEGKDEKWLHEVLSKSPEHQKILLLRRLEKKRQTNLILAGIMALIALPFVIWTARRGWLQAGSTWCSSIVANKISQLVTPVARLLFRRRYLVIAVLFCAGVIFELHGYSIGMWDTFIKEKTPDYSYFSIGNSRAIRSDEWLLSTPWCIAQTQTTPRFPSLNTNLYSSGMYMGLSTPNCPVLDITAIGQFHNWGFFLFGGARGLAWSWWVRYLGIFLLAIEFFLLVAGNNKVLAFAGALSVTLASPTQWWDTTMPYHLLYFFGFSVACWHFIHAGSTTKAALFAAICVVFFCSFVLAFYPPFQLPFLVMLLAVCSCFCRSYPRRLFATSRLALTVVGILVAAFVLWWFAVDNRDGIERIANTAYPGARFFTGGHWSNLANVLNPMLSIYFPFRDATFSNNCELSMFITPLPALLIVAPWLFYRVKPSMEKRVFCAFLVVGTVLVCWCLFQFPDFLARNSLLFMINSNRAFVTASFALQLAGISGIFLMKQDGLSLNRAVSTVISGIAALTFVSYAFLNEPAKGYFFPMAVSLTGIFMIAYSATLFGLLNYGLLRGRVCIFVGALVLYALPAGCTVHPLSSGISPIMDKKLAVVSRRIQSANPSARWIEIGRRRTISQYLTAIGLPVITGVHCIPDVGLWRRFDPDGKYERGYNRYAHVTASLTDDGPRIENQGTDHVHCSFRPADLLKIPGLTFVVSPWELTPSRFELLEHMEIDKLYIYRLRAEHEEDGRHEGDNHSVED